LGASLELLLTRSLETRDVVTETLHRYREINLLYRIGETIGSCLDPDKIPPLALGEVQRLLRADVGAVFWSSPPGTATAEAYGELAASFGAAEHVRALQQALSQAITHMGDASHAAIVNVARLSRPVHGGMGTILCAQMKVQERRLGALVLGRVLGQPEFTAGDGKLATALTHQAATALETARLHQEEVERQRLAEELEIGRQIQLGLLPERCPLVPGWEFAAAYRAARQVGGDFYDWIQLPDEPQRLSMVIADVTGKGIPSALFMACSRAVIRSESVAGRDPALTLREANRILVQDMHSRLFLSVFYATLDTRSGRVIYARGGHDRPLWLRGDSGESHWLTANGRLLGAFEDVALEEQELALAPGDLLVFYTDGVTEARDCSGKLFGRERLKALVEASAAAGAQQLQEAIVEAVDAFAGDTPQSDDLTLLVVKRCE
jgi:serine phosphatase RsbU (regulator of sigma subunit)